MRMREIRLGVIGAGFISDYHLAGIQSAGGEVAVIASTRLERARAKADQYGVADATTDIDAVLGRPDIDAVVIATPDHTHEDLAIAAIRVGKAVLLQKPMARTSAGARRIIDAASQAGVPLVTSFMHRYFEEVEALRGLLAARRLGEVVMVRQRNATPGADWAPWLYDPRYSDGVVLQLGVHGIDLLRHIFGEIEAVQATSRTVCPDRTLADGTPVSSANEDLALALYRFRSGLTAVHEMSYCEIAGTDRFRMEVYGTAATAWLRSERGLLAVGTAEGPGGAHWETPSMAGEDAGTRHHRHVLDMFEGRAPLDTSAQDGLATLLVAEAIARSAATGRWVDVWP
jgi:myo-inositol 2-dehydrogenase/D-chiro-inositol 1-dehydrogenase